MEQYQLEPIGIINCKEGEYLIRVDEEYRPALTGLKGFSHVNVFWWFSDCADAYCRSMKQAESPYKNGPQVMGIFATRSPARPNPLAMSTAQVLDVDYEKGEIRVAYIDANDQTPLLDLKPYTPSMDRIEEPEVPQWCSHWPKSLEASEDFAWEKEFNF